MPVYNARRSKGVIAAKLKAKTNKDSKYLEQLYTLEGMIRELRVLFENAKEG